MKPRFVFLLSLALAASFPARAEADGPDHYRVTGVASGHALTMRAEPSTGASRVARIPADAQCLRNLGCQGGLSFEEFSTLSATERQQRLLANPRWCKVSYMGQTGWVAGRYLAEGSCAQIRRKE